MLPKIGHHFSNKIDLRPVYVISTAIWCLSNNSNFWILPNIYLFSSTQDWDGAKMFCPDSSKVMFISQFGTLKINQNKYYVIFENLTVEVIKKCILQKK